ncbi:MAG: hypothetical protein L0Y44_07740 [Phycisphaerales bacterium]|nr:hypothetical protein [Phycisphaerales bacterium]MCI0676109.1 hypothetical protein [Phycisphaerales bacterium]
MPLPIVGFPGSLTIDPVREVEGTDEAPIVIVAPIATEAKAGREVTLPVEAMNATELADLLAQWENGKGAFKPFSYTVPGDAGPRKWVFRDPELDIEFITAKRADAVIVLLDVTPPDC